MKPEKHRFVIIVDREDFEEFKKLAEKENRSASNLAATLIKNYIKENSEQ